MCLAGGLYKLKEILNAAIFIFVFQQTKYRVFKITQQVKLLF
jgi:hypothetical protein